MANVYLTEAAKLKTWDPAAVRFGPVTCCWWFYWNGDNSNDKAAHGGVDFVPWWLNQVYWQDQIAGARTLDVFDMHAYPDADTGGLTKAQLQALAASIYRDYWDPTFVSPSSSINQQWTTNIQPNKTIPFRIPRMRAMVNMIYPGTPLAFTEWSAAFAGESDFSTALGDADAYGIFGRERLSFASRWEAPAPANPNYQALKLYTNYDGAHHGFGTTSVAAANTGDANALLAATPRSTPPAHAHRHGAQQRPQQHRAGRFARRLQRHLLCRVTHSPPAAPTAISRFRFQSRGTATKPFPRTPPPCSSSAVVWPPRPPRSGILNPDVIMVPAGGTVTLHPKITSGSSNVTLSSAVFDSYEGASACAGLLSLTARRHPQHARHHSPSQPVATPGFCHFTVTGNDGTVTQTQGGWIVVGNPPAYPRRHLRKQPERRQRHSSRQCTHRHSHPGVIGRCGHGSWYPVHHFSRHTVEWNHLRYECHCHHQLIRSSLRHPHPAVHRRDGDRPRP